MLGHNDLFRHIVLVGPFVELLQLYFLFLILIFPLPLDHFSLCVGGWGGAFVGIVFSLEDVGLELVRNQGREENLLRTRMLSCKKKGGVLAFVQHSIEEALCVLRAAVGLTPLYFLGSVPLDARVPHLHRVKAPTFFFLTRKRPAWMLSFT